MDIIDCLLGWAFVDNKNNFVSVLFGFFIVYSTGVACLVLLGLAVVLNGFYLVYGIK